MQSLNLMITKIVEYFDVSVKFLQQNLMDYILEYGRYGLVNNLFDDVFTIIPLICIPLALFTFFQLCDVFEYDFSENAVSSFKRKMKPVLIIAISIFSFLSIMTIAYELISYKVSPTMYSVQEVYQDFVINNKGE